MSKRRGARRDSQRLALHVLRSMGCTCSPTLTRIDPSENPFAIAPNAIGYHNAHKPGCGYGERCAALNAAGIRPQFLYREPRCER